MSLVINGEKETDADGFLLEANFSDEGVTSPPPRP